MITATFILPYNDNNGQHLDAIHADLQKELCFLFNGYTRTDGNGAWADATGRVIEEPVAIYTIAATPAALHSFEPLALLYGRRAHQQAIYLCIDGNARIIDV